MGESPQRRERNGRQPRAFIPLGSWCRQLACRLPAARFATFAGLELRSIKSHRGCSVASVITAPFGTGGGAHQRKWPETVPDMSGVCRNLWAGGPHVVVSTDFLPLWSPRPTDGDS